MGTLGNKGFQILIICISINLFVFLKGTALPMFPYLPYNPCWWKGPKPLQLTDKVICRLFTKHYCPQNSCITQHNLHAVWAQKGFSALNVRLCFSAEHLPLVWVRCQGSFRWTQLFSVHPSDQLSWPLVFLFNKTDLRIEAFLAAEVHQPQTQKWLKLGSRNWL